MLPSVVIAAFDKDRHVVSAFLLTIAIMLGVSLLGGKKPERGRGFHARDGLLTVGLVWIAVSLFGSLPFLFSGEIPHFVDAFFETVSGFTTTGASILTNVEAMSRGLLFWRSATHFVGGMGVLVFALAIVPMADSSGGASLHILRAESTGPQVGKLMPKMRDTAKMLYTIYVAMTVLQIILLLLGGVPLFDSFIIAMGSAGTGGFASKTASLAAYSVYAQVVTGIFIALFGVNFNVYFMLVIRDCKKALFNEEVRVYFCIMASSAILIAVNLIGVMGEPVLNALHQAAFQVSSIMTTTGFATTDFNLWPVFSKSILLLLMILGSCAGSTGGGIKTARAIILAKSAKNSVMKMLRPRQVNVVRMNGQALDSETVDGVLGFATVYSIVCVVSVLIISLDNFSIETNLSAVLATINNIGPGLEIAGPTGSFAPFSIMSKLVFIINMLIGRLELFPMLLLFLPKAWKRAS